MGKSIKFLVLSILVTLLVTHASKVCAQLGIFLKVEVVNSLESEEFAIGQKLQYRTSEYPDTWRKQRITDILVNDQVIILEDDFIHIDDIVTIRVPNRPVQALGAMLFSFGVVWNTFGTILHFTSDFEFRDRDIVIGAFTMGSGYLISRFLKYDTYHLDKSSRLRIIDRRFIVD